MLRSVDFPEPDSPTTATHSPRATSRRTSPSNGASGPKRFASPRTCSMSGLDDVGEDAAHGAQHGTESRAVEEPLLLCEDGDRGEGDGDLQQRHRDREIVVRMERLLALLVPLVGRLLVLLRVLHDLGLLLRVALRLG